MLLPRPEALTLSEGQYPLNLQLQPQALSRTPEEESQCPSHLHADVTGISGSLCLKQLLIQPRPAAPTAFPIPTAEAETVASSLIPRLSHPHAVCVQNRTASQHLHDTTPAQAAITSHLEAAASSQLVFFSPPLTLKWSGFHTMHRTILLKQKSRHNSPLLKPPRRPPCH